MILLSKMIDSQMISQKMAAYLLMVDFANPIYSDKREALLQYVPKEIKVGREGSHFDEEFVKNILQSDKANDLDQPEGEFIANWSNENSNEFFVSRMEAYFKKLQQNRFTQEGLLH